MTELILGLVKVLGETNNQIAVIAFCLMLMIMAMFMTVMKLLKSVFDLKRSMYEAELLPDRGKKGERY